MTALTKRSDGRTPGNAAMDDRARAPWSAAGWSPPAAGPVVFSVEVRTAAQLVRSRHAGLRTGGSAAHAA